MVINLARSSESERDRECRADSLPAERESERREVQSDVSRSKNNRLAERAVQSSERESRVKESISMFVSDASTKQHIIENVY